MPSSVSAPAAASVGPEAGGSDAGPELPLLRPSATFSEVLAGVAIVRLFALSDSTLTCNPPPKDLFFILPALIKFCDLQNDEGVKLSPSPPVFINLNLKK